MQLGGEVTTKDDKTDYDESPNILVTVHIDSPVSGSHGKAILNVPSSSFHPHPPDPGVDAAKRSPEIDGVKHRTDTANTGIIEPQD